MLSTVFYLWNIKSKKIKHDFFKLFNNKQTYSAEKWNQSVNWFVILTINKTAFSNCSEILSATFSAHGVGLSGSKELNRKLEMFSIIITVLCVMFMFTNRLIVKLQWQEVWKLTYCLIRRRWLDNIPLSSAESVNTTHPPETTPSL